MARTCRDNRSESTRPRKSAHAYAQVWTEAGSPLAAITAQQADRLQALLGNSVTVAYAMRYGRPAIADQLRALSAAGCERILLAPLYPQYCAATTAAAVDAAADALRSMRWQPALRTLPPYHDDDVYIAALALRSTDPSVAVTARITRQDRCPAGCQSVAREQ